MAQKKSNCLINRQHCMYVIQYLYIHAPVLLLKKKETLTLLEIPLYLYKSHG